MNQTSCDESFAVPLILKTRTSDEDSRKNSRRQPSSRWCVSFLIMDAIIRQIKHCNKNLRGATWRHGDLDCDCIAIFNYQATGLGNLAPVLHRWEVFNRKMPLTEAQVSVSTRSGGDTARNRRKSGQREDFSRAGLTSPYCGWPLPPLLSGLFRRGAPRGTLSDVSNGGGGRSAPPSSAHKSIRQFRHAAVCLTSEESQEKMKYFCRASRFCSFVFFLGFLMKCFSSTRLFTWDGGSLLM